MTSWNDMQTSMQAIAKRNAVRDIERMAKQLCDKANCEKVRAAMPDKNAPLDDAAYKKLLNAFGNAIKATASAKAE
jgi:hypothetical protein